MNIRQFVFKRLDEGQNAESIWRELGAHWNYVSRLAREWKSQQRGSSNVTRLADAQRKRG